MPNKEVELKPLPYSASKSEIYAMYQGIVPYRKMLNVIKEIMKDTRKNYNKFERILNTKEMCLLYETVSPPPGYSSNFKNGEHWLDRLMELDKIDRIRN